uniref:glutathione transferase n=1 Tax=Anopheles stephensi TaxID=30069 RepID=A0A182YJR6_ANOST
MLPHLIRYVPCAPVANLFVGMDFYHLPLSAPCQAVRLVAKALKLHLNLKELDLLSGEHLKPEFLKINPQHTIPTLVDNDFVLWESRAILTYLCEKYGQNDGLYPKDPKKRAMVNQRLYFDMGTLYQRFSEAFYPVMMEGKELNPEKVQKLDEALEFLETFLDKTAFAAGDKLTVADLSLLASITTIDVTAAYDLSKYANIQRWYGQLKESVAGHEEICVEGAHKFREAFNAISNCCHIVPESESQSSTMPLDLYYNIISPPCRVVLLFAKWLKLDLNLIELDVLKREHYKPEFLKLNPQHYLPTLVDGDVVVWESSAVLIYLAEKYSTDDTLYPKDVALRAKVNQRLFYDIGTLMRSVTTYYHPILMGGEGKLEDFKKVQDAVAVLNSFLHDSRWTAGEHITVADFAIAVTVAALDGLLNFDFTVYPNVHRWYEQCKRELVGYTDITREAAQKTQAFLERFRAMRTAEQQQLCQQQHPQQQACKEQGQQEPSDPHKQQYTELQTPQKPRARDSPKHGAPADDKPVATAGPRSDESSKMSTED